MRFFALPLIAFTLVGLQAQAQTPQAPATGAPPASTPPAAMAPSTAAPSSSATPMTHHRTRMTVAQRFEQANTTHDGKLTLDQAKAGMPAIAKNFDAIDKDKKGYVTLDDIHAYYAARHAKHATHGTSS